MKPCPLTGLQDGRTYGANSDQHRCNSASDGIQAFFASLLVILKEFKISTDCGQLLDTWDNRSNGGLGAGNAAKPRTCFGIVGVFGQAVAGRLSSLRNRQKS